MQFRVSRQESEYVSILKAPIQDAKLSWKAKGLLIYLLSLPDDKTIKISEMAEIASDGESSLRSGIRELRDAGYIRQETIRNSKGVITGTEYVVREYPDMDNPDPENPHVENPHMENRSKSGENKAKRSENQMAMNPLKDSLKDSLNNNLKALKDLKDSTDEEPFENRTETPEKVPKTLENQISGLSDHQEMLNAISAVTGLDLKIRSNLGRTLRASKELRQAGYDHSDIRKFGDMWLNDWRYRRDRNLPTLPVVMAEIGKVKAQRSVAKSGVGDQLDHFRELYRESKQKERQG